jgi:hypothetical protein
VKDAQAAGQTRELADWSALGTLGITWDASEALAAHQSNWYAVRAGETLAGYSVSVWAAGWDMSAARAGADPCGRKAEAHEIDEKLSPLNAPIERRNAMRAYAAELVDDLGGKDNLSGNDLSITNKILGPDYPRVIASE